MPLFAARAALAGLALFLSTAAHGNPPFTIEELGRLAAMTSERVPEIARARSIARAKNATLAAYGGTSREILGFVRERVQRLGSVAAYEAWLAQQPTIHLLDWHRLSSDLDFMLIPNEPSPTAERITELRTVLQRIRAEFPSTVFHGSFDMNLSTDFFTRYPVGHDHVEGISNIPISDRGIEYLPQLEMNGVHLTRLGLDQYRNGELLFSLMPGFENASHPKRSDTFGNLRQVLRWLRYASEHPELTLPESSRAVIRNLLQHTLTHDREGVLRLLRDGDASARNHSTANANSNGEKIIAALEKLQLYSQNSQATYRLLEDFGIVALAREAGIESRRIMRPLALMASAERERRIAAGSLQPLGRQIAVRHRTSLPSAQSISRGAIWMSNGETIINGRTTAALLGEGLYAAPGIASLLFGDIYVEMVLSEHAVEGVDFHRSGDYYVIHTLNALAKNADGSYRIQRVDRDVLLGNQIAQLRNQDNGADGQPLVSRNERLSILRSLSQLLSPEGHSGDVALFAEARTAARTLEMEQDFMQRYLERPGVLRTIFSNAQATDQPFQREIFDAAMTRDSPLSVAALKAVLEAAAVHRSPILEDFLGQMANAFARNPWDGFGATVVQEVLAHREGLLRNHPELMNRVPALLRQIDLAKNRTLLEAQPTMVAIQQLYPAEWANILERSIESGVADNFRWDLTDPVQHAILRRVLDGPLTPRKLHQLGSGTFHAALSAELRGSPAFRARWETALRAALTSPQIEERRLAVEHADRMLSPETNPADRALFAEALGVAIHSHPGPFDVTLNRIFGDPEKIRRVLYTEDPAYAPYRAPLLRSLARTPWPGLETRVLAILLRNPEALLRQYPWLRDTIEQLLVRIETDPSATSGALSHDFLSALHGYSPDHWRRVIQRALLNGETHNVSWRLDDATGMALLKDMLRTVPADAELRLHSALDAARQRYPGIPLETEHLEASAFDSIPDVALRDRLQQAHRDWSIRRGLQQTMSSLSRSSPDLFARQFLPAAGDRTGERFAVGQYTLSTFVQGGTHADQLVAYFHNLDAARANDLLNLLEMHREWTLAFLRDNPAIRARLRSLLGNESIAPATWRRFPWNISNAQDVAFLQSYVRRDSAAARENARETNTHATRRESELLNRWLPQVIQDLTSEHGGRVSQLFGPIQTPQLSVSDYYLAALLRRFALHGYNATAGGLTEPEKAEVRRFFAAPIEARLRSHYRDLLASPGEGRRHALARLGGAHAGDDPVAILQIVNEPTSRGPRPEELWPLLRVNAARWAQFRSRLAERWRASPAQLAQAGAYPWDLTDPNDLALLRDLHRRIPVDANARFDRLVGEIVANGSSGGGYGDDNIQSLLRRLTDPARRSELLARHRERAARAGLDTALRTLAQRNLQALVEALPDAPQAHVTNVNSYTLFNSETAEWRAGDDVTAALNAYRYGRRLSPAERATVDFFLEHHDPGFFAAMILVSETSRREAMRYLREHPSRVALMLGLLAVDENVVTSHRYFDSLGRALARNAGWRNDVLRELSAATAPAAQLKGFPWDLARRADRDVLLGHLRAGRGAELESLFERLVTAFPEESIRSFGEHLSDPLKQAAMVTWSERFSGELIARFARGGFPALSTTEARDLRAFLAAPLTLSSVHGLFTEVAAIDGPGRAHILARLRALDRRDDLHAVLNIFTSRHYPFNAAVRTALLDDVDFRNRLRARVRERVRAGEWLGEIYPWDLGNAADVALLREIDTMYPRDPMARLRRVEAATHARYPSLNLQVFLSDRDAERIPDAALRTAVREANAAYWGRHHVDSAMLRLAFQDPDRFERLFPHLPLPTLTYFRATPDAASWTIDNHDSIEAIFNKVRGGQPLSPAEQRVVDFYLRAREPSFLVLALNSPLAPRAIEALRTEPTGGIPTALRILEQGTSEFGRAATARILEALAQDPVWRDRLLTHFSSPALAGHTWADFPLDLTNAAHRALLPAAGATRNSILAELLVVRRELATDHHLPLADPAHPERLDPHVITDAPLRDRYARLQRQLALVHRGNENAGRHTSQSCLDFMSDIHQALSTP